MEIDNLNDSSIMENMIINDKTELSSDGVLLNNNELDKAKFTEKEKKNTSDGKENLDEKLLKVITKLLNKAGRDPRLTPRLLREKAEERLSLEKDALKIKRDAIKEMIITWWKENMLKKKENNNVDKEATDIKVTQVNSKLPAVEKESKAEKKLQSTVSTTVAAANKEIKSPISSTVIKDKEAKEKEPKFILKSLVKFATVMNQPKTLYQGLSDATVEQRIDAVRKRMRESGLIFSDCPTVEEIEAATAKMASTQANITENSNSSEIATSEMPAIPSIVRASSNATQSSTSSNKPRESLSSQNGTPHNQKKRKEREGEDTNSVAIKKDSKGFVKQRSDEEAEF
eukprot:gene7586-10335_t